MLALELRNFIRRCKQWNISIPAEIWLGEQDFNQLKDDICPTRYGESLTSTLNKDQILIFGLLVSCSHCPGCNIGETE